jgi:hypothetical protein
MNPLAFTPQDFCGAPPIVFGTPGGMFAWPSYPILPQSLCDRYTSPLLSQSLSPQVASTPYPPISPWVPRSSQSIQIAPWLIPNPYNPQVPHMLWNVSQVPITAKRLTGNHVVINLKPHFDDEATFPGVPEVHIVSNIHVINKMWGAIIVKSDAVVKVSDILQGIYQFFQTPLTQSEVDLMTASDAKNYEKMVEAMHRRCLREPCLFERAWMQGLKRVDCLGDMASFGGLYVIEQSVNARQFHLILLAQNSY